LRSLPGPDFAGVLGWPLEHTLSPVIHNAAFRQLGLHWIYLAWPVPKPDLAAAVGGLRALGAMGANVTMPHKETIVTLLDEVSGDARSVGAVNTVQRLGDRLIGHNTDVDGFREFLIDAGVRASGLRALILGAGGSARAVVKGLADLDIGEVVIAARRPLRGAELTSLVGSTPAAVHPWEDAARLAGQADLVINATPVGMKRGENPIPGAQWRTDQAVIDLIYRPPATPVIESARAAGASAWGGMGMLVHQAAASIRIWTGQDPPLETMSAAALHALGGLSQ
jgi:shikimate dehydrogenase